MLVTVAREESALSEAIIKEIKSIYACALKA